MKVSECKNCGARMPMLVFDKKIGHIFACNSCGSRTRATNGFDEALRRWNDGEFDFVEVEPSVRELVKTSDGYCPCEITQDEDTECPCKAFREQATGRCNCGRFEKMEDDLK